MKTDRPTDEHLARIREVVRVRLAQLGIQQFQIAKAIGTSKANVSQQLKKTRNIQWLAQVCGVDLDVLMTGDEMAVLAAPKPAPGWLDSLRKTIDAVNAPE